MNIIYFEEIDSTQKYLLKNLDKYELPVCIWSDYQTDGIGSRGNKWIGKKGNLFFSFAYPLNFFKNVPLQSFSVYFGWVLKKTLNELGSNVVLKWPNDIYLIDDKPLKAGGIITSVKNETLVCGIGLNTSFSPSEEFGCLDIKIKNDKILQNFFAKLEQKPNFDEVIKEYKKEFETTKKIFGIEGELDKDGALIKNKEKVYSRR